MSMHVYFLLYINMKRRLVHVLLELRRYRDLSQHIKEPHNGIYCLNKKKRQFEN